MQRRRLHGHTRVVFGLLKDLRDPPIWIVPYHSWDDWKSCKRRAHAGPQPTNPALALGFSFAFVLASILHLALDDNDEV